MPARQVIELALADAVEGFDRVAERHDGAGLTGELLGNDEVLAEELLDTTGAADEDLVLFLKLVHTEDGDDVLQFLVLLQDALDLVGNAEVLGTDDAGLQDAGGRAQRIHSGVDTICEIGRESSVVASRCANVVAGAGSV